MKKCLIAVLLIGAFSFLAYFVFCSYAFTFFVHDQQIIRLVLKKNFFSQIQKELLVEVVNTEASTAQGLSLRNELVSNTGQKIDGLLFIFPQKEIRQFWMKDMLFNIDICWLNGINFLTCEREAQAPSIGDQQLIKYDSPAVSNLVLETQSNYLSNEQLKAKLFFQWW